MTAQSWRAWATRPFPRKFSVSPSLPPLRLRYTPRSIWTAPSFKQTQHDWEASLEESVLGGSNDLDGHRRCRGKIGGGRAADGKEGPEVVDDSRRHARRQLLLVARQNQSGSHRPSRGRKRLRRCAD